ncbi:glutamate-rich protein 2 [Neosynchiropus ocellatus]
MPIAINDATARDMNCGETVNTGSTKSADTMAHTLKPLEQVSKSGEEVPAEEDLDKNQRAPVDLLSKFLQALKKPDLQMARNLCRMILVYEPDYPEAREFLSLLKKKLQDDVDEDNDDEETASSSSTLTSDDEEETDE